MLLGKLTRPVRPYKSPISIDKLPKTTSQLRLLTTQGRKLVDSGGSPTRLKAVLDQLEAMVQVAAADATIQAHEAANIKRQLEIKKNWKKSQARLQASPNKHGMTWTRPEIDRALARQAEKEQEAQRKRRNKQTAVGRKRQVEPAATDSILDEENIQATNDGR